MASVYILFSEKLNRFYTGSCEDLSYRIEQHFNKDFNNSFTAKTDDWELFFFVDNLHYAQARLIEQHIKNMKSKVYIQNLKKYPEILLFFNIEAIGTRLRYSTKKPSDLDLKAFL
jgi:putative endonuclease